PSLYSPSLHDALPILPGSNARALDKARTQPVDGVVLDLEDAVAPDAKEAARDQVVAAVKEGRFGAREVFVRINGLDTPWGTETADRKSTRLNSSHEWT